MFKFLWPHIENVYVERITGMFDIEINCNTVTFTMPLLSVCCWRSWTKEAANMPEWAAWPVWAAFTHGHLDTLITSGRHCTAQMLTTIKHVISRNRRHRHLGRYLSCWVVGASTAVVAIDYQFRPDRGSWCITPGALGPSSTDIRNRWRSPNKCNALYCERAR